MSELLGHCPFISTQADSGTVLPFPSEDHRCSSSVLPVPISTIHQQKYCLTAEHIYCPVFNPARAKAMGSPIEPVPPPPPAQEPEPPATAAPIDVIAEEPTAVPFDERVSWLDSSHDASAETMALFGVEAAAPQSSPVLPGEPLIFPWEEQIHPDFAADQDLFPPPQKFHQSVRFRRLLVILLLLALIPVVWWLYNNGRTLPGFMLDDDSARGIVVTLPTAALPTDEANNAGGGGAGSGGPQATLTAAAAGGGGSTESTTTPEAEPTLTDLERIAMTATALFADATAVTQCVAPSWWVNYVIEDGDTIEALAQSRGVQRELLIVANCLAHSELEVGRTIFLPPVGVVTDVTVEPTDTPTATVTASPTRAPVIFPTAALFPTATVFVNIFPTAIPTLVPPTSAPPTTAPPPAPPTAVPPTAAPTEEPSPVPTSSPIAPPTATAPPPPEMPTTAPPTQEPGEPLPVPPEPTP